MAPPVEHWIYWQNLGTTVHGRRHLLKGHCSEMAPLPKAPGKEDWRESWLWCLPHLCQSVSLSLWMGPNPIIWGLFLSLHSYFPSRPRQSDRIPIRRSHAMRFPRKLRRGCDCFVVTKRMKERQLPPVPIASSWEYSHWLLAAKGIFPSCCQGHGRSWVSWMGNRITQITQSCLSASEGGSTS